MSEPDRNALLPDVLRRAVQSHVRRPVDDVVSIVGIGKGSRARIFRGAFEGPPAPRRRYSSRAPCQSNS